MKAMNDSELAALSAGGDEEAFGCLIDRHYMFIYKVAYKWIGNKEDAEDLAQDVCVKLAHKIGMYSPDAKFTTWLYTIIRNSALDLAKSAERKNVKLDIDDVKIEATSVSQEEKLIQKQALQTLYALPDKIKDAVILVYMEGLSHAEAAKILGCAETTISWRVFQGKKKLKRLLK